MKGWNIILPGNVFDVMPDLIQNPMGVAAHVGITESGKVVQKNRATQDFLFPGRQAEN